MTASVPIDLKVRDARDRLIDLLGIGETYPLRDVDVQEEQLTVNFNEPANITIDPGQLGVTYELYDKDEQTNLHARADGNGAATALAGPPITGDRTFRVRASKIAHPERSTFLAQSALFKVGLDTRLRVTLPGIPALNPLLSNPADTDARLIAYGSVVVVRVAASQASAMYSLEYADASGAMVATPPAMGTGADIELVSTPLTEDTRIRVRVTRTFDAAEGRTNLDALLDTVLTVAVRASAALAVSIEGAAQDGSPLVDPAGATMLTVLASQKSAIYSAYLRPLLDRDFATDPASAPQSLRVLVPTSSDLPAHEVLVRAPPRRVPFQVQAGYVQQGESKAGNGAALKLNLLQIQSDSVIVIRASKEHREPTTGQLLGESSVQLEQAVAALPRPDAVPALTLTVTKNAEGPGGKMLVTGGQPGVFYHFRLPATTAEIGLSAYFHRSDEQDAQQNRGLGQLRVENDFAVARTAANTGADLTLQRPLTPLVDLAQIPTDAVVSVTAIWARTGVAWLMARNVSLLTT